MKNAALLFSLVSVAAVLGVACSVSTVNAPNDGGASTSDGGTSPSEASTTTPPGNVPPASTTEASVDIAGTCPSFTACGGAIDGTYDYTAGCLGDLFVDAKKQCPTLDASGVKVVVKGSLHFTAGNILTRDAVATMSGVVKFPAACVAGQCAAVQTTLRSNGFPGASCTGTSSCDCTVTHTDTTKNATTYTQTGAAVITGDGETYSTCVKGAELTYAGKSAGAEDGTWSLKKR